MPAATASLINSHETINYPCNEECSTCCGSGSGSSDNGCNRNSHKHATYCDCCSENSSGSLSPVPELVPSTGSLPFRIQSECRDNAALGKRRASTSSSLGSMTLSSSQSSLSFALSDASPPDSNSLLVAIIGWYPLLVLRMLKTLIYMTCSQSLMALPVLWLWFVWRAILLPLAIVRYSLAVLDTLRVTRTRLITAAATTTTKTDRTETRIAAGRTIMISNGSTIQALHLARNFSEIGIRVVCFEFEGLFPLAKFSNSVTKFYVLPKSCRDNDTDYAEHLQRIVRHENVMYFIPVCVTNTAVLDAHVKPHLEAINCTTFCPDIKDLALLDDCYTMLKFCEQFNKPVPDYRLVYNRDDLLDFYAENAGCLPLRLPGIYYMYTNGISTRTQKIQLPLNRNDLPADLLAGIANLVPPAFIVHEPAGYENFFTCTTVKNSRLIANATCHLDGCGLVAVADTEIDRWLHDYFQMMSKHNDSLSGHVTFKFCRRRRPRHSRHHQHRGGRRAIDDATATDLIPLSCKCSVSLPYVCYENTHAKILSETEIGPGAALRAPVANNSGRYWIHAEVYDTLRNPTLATVGKLIGTVLDKREALFSIRDPLPYCAYFNLKVLRFIRQRRRQIPRTFNILWYR